MVGERCLPALSSVNFCCVLQIKEILVEESNVQPVNSPVTVSYTAANSVAAHSRLPSRLSVALPACSVVLCWPSPLTACPTYHPPEIML